MNPASPIFFMTKINIVKQVRTTRNLEGNISRSIEYDAITIKTPYMYYHKYGDRIRRQIGDYTYYHSIDKLSYTFPRDLLNEDGYALRYKSGAISITLTKNGDYFVVNLHREYIPHDRNIAQYVKDAFEYLIYCMGVFKLPTKKTVTDYRKNKKVMVKSLPENNVATPDEFFRRIYEQRKLSCIELCFDMHLNMLPLFKLDDFTVVNTTLYSNDYKVYGSGNMKRSLLCIYDKAKEQKARKNRNLYCLLWRLEMRLHANSFTILKKKERELLDNDYEGLLEWLKPYIRRHLRKLGIDFSKLIEALPDEQWWLYNLLANL